MLLPDVRRPDGLINICQRVVHVGPSVKPLNGMPFRIYVDRKKEKRRPQIRNMRLKVGAPTILLPCNLQSNMSWGFQQIS